MRTQILDHADVGDSRREGSLAPSGHLVDVPQLSSCEPGTGLLEGRVVALDVADSTDQACFTERLRQPSGRCDVMSERLLDERMHSCGSEFQADLLMKDRRHRYHAVVQPGRNELL